MPQIAQLPDDIPAEFKFVEPGYQSDRCFEIHTDPETIEQARGFEIKGNGSMLIREET